ncbi:hypothetical protein FFONT_1186 [Fervidicoccus fontis Kam940]|uniref:Uncharacterized protein n=1 Tax=Fervidicoccus fontis (strain DSM 19380 / JCM 18336 / VKM B-2539 / Kam940) TaxID=1163730 RepID=I0A2G7_FERFK|nr:hypothetical protein FFONT_1186 [Fervidicoccus fontis Kam940]PMB76924.1 MAG: hypothetical protein C0177_04620 [Fervidicoccus fontis]
MLAQSVCNIYKSEGVEVFAVEISPINRNIIEKYIQANCNQASINIIPPHSIEELQMKKNNTNVPIIIFSIGENLDDYINDFLRLKRNVRLLFTHVSKGINRIFGMNILRLEKDYSGFYIKYGGLKKYLKYKNGKLLEADEGESYFLEKAYKVLLDSMLEFGEITLEDATNVLMGRLKISKNEAKKLLYELIKRKKLEFKGGILHIN